MDYRLTLVAVPNQRQHYDPMSRENTDQSAPDLFSPQGPGESPPEQRSDASFARQASRPVLPQDLSRAVQYLNDRDLDRLVVAVIDEAKRRGRLPSDFEPSDGSAGPVATQRPSELATRSRKPKIVAPALTLGQTNAVRAALKAGIKPTRIARQFGLSLSDVRKVLTSHDSE